MTHRAQLQARSQWFKEAAQRYGFQSCRMAPAGPLDDEARKLETWLQQGYHGSMGYMEQNIEKRLDPRLLVPGAQSVVSLAMNYYPGNARQPGGSGGHPKVSRYAWGRDYHKVLRTKMKNMLREAHQVWGQFAARGFVDSAPVMDKAWAQRAGVGWIGKHTNLISRKMGSWFFLAELVIDLELQSDVAVPDYCGRCTRCIDACPTDAIVAPYQLDARRCISYFTIEVQEADAQLREHMEDWIFGCDICQEVCPWNRFAVPHQEPDFQARNQLPERPAALWLEMDEATFNERFAGTPLRRAGYEGLRKNLKHAGFTDAENLESSSG